MKLDVRSFSLTTGIFWGIFLFFMTWWIIFLDGASGDVTLIGKVYRGYNISITGSFIGLLWGFFDGLIGGAIFAWLYNYLLGKFVAKTE